MRVLDTVDRRVLGAFRCVDAFSRQSVLDPLAVGGRALDIRRNASGVFVVFQALGLRDLTLQFNPTAPWPSARAFEVTIVPAGARYFARRAQLSLPRKPTPVNDPDSSMRPQDVTLFPGPAAVLGFNWAVVRVSVTKGVSRIGVPWAMLRLTRDSDAAVLATGMSDRQGEAVLAVPGIGQSASVSDEGDVMTTTVAATVTAYVDPDNFIRSDTWLPDPDDVLNDLDNPVLKTLTQAVKIGRGTQSHFEMPIAV
ncbi:MAG: hypothetical protein ABJA98_10935 [Acidobacteriota bacterium]